MKIHVFILRKDRCIDEIEVSPDDQFFKYNKGLYSLESDAVNLTTKNDVVSSFPELYYFEGDPFPIKATVKAKENETNFLEEIVLENALEQLAGVPSETMQLIFDYIRDPKKILFLVFILIIGYAVLFGGVLG
ncbi:MAG: hypothetical protein Q6356_003255 [Candidatus Wukongarchaeota archaeon]|nr:hypothetical protein [Candidatus Wukongarchaeota archaeon]